MSQMAYNPYAPPTVDVAEVAPPDADATLPPFFAVSVTKLAVMTICTFNVYQVYWFYRHWRRIAERGQEAVSPIWRAIFAVIFCYPCFAHIRDHGLPKGVPQYLPAGPLAIGYIVCSLTWALPDPYGFMSMAAFVFTLPVQRHANMLNGLEVPAHDRNSRFTVWNWVAIVLGGALLLLALAGIFLVSPEV